MDKKKSVERTEQEFERIKEEKWLLVGAAKISKELVEWRRSHHT